MMVVVMVMVIPAAIKIMMMVVVMMVISWISPAPILGKACFWTLFCLCPLAGQCQLIGGLDE